MKIKCFSLSLSPPKLSEKNIKTLKTLRVKFSINCHKGRGEPRHLRVEERDGA